MVDREDSMNAGQVVSVEVPAQTRVLILQLNPEADWLTHRDGFDYKVQEAVDNNPDFVQSYCSLPDGTRQLVKDGVTYHIRFEEKQVGISCSSGFMDVVIELLDEQILQAQEQTVDGLQTGQQE